MRRLAPVLLVAYGVACSGAESAQPPGDVAVRVETDAPVDALGLRLRVDIFAEDGRWLESREAAAGAEHIWPASFALSSTTSRRALLRVRAFPDGATRPYEGERFVARPSPGPASGRVVIPPGTNEPRLLVGGGDRTPEREPQPELAIDPS